MKGHMKPSTRENPDHIILHIETNNLKETTPDVIAKSIIGLVLTMKVSSQNVSIAKIIMRNDNFEVKAIGSKRSFTTILF